MDQRRQAALRELSAALGRPLAAATAAFDERYGAPPRWAAAAPGRVNLIGEHLDYNGGFVLPLAIEARTLVVVGPGGGQPGRMRVYSRNLDESAEFRVEDSQVPVPSAAAAAADGMAGGRRRWAAYVHGVCAIFQQAADLTLPALDWLIDSEVPLGSGLSSSAALEVAVATLLEEVTGRQLPPRQKALVCQEAEHRYAGVPCGVMDQFAAVFGERDQLLLLDCDSLEITQVPWAADAPQLLIINSMVQHQLGDSQYPLRRQQCQAAKECLPDLAWRDVAIEDLAAWCARMPSEQIARRGRHVVTEIDRVRRTVTAVRRCDWPEVGRLMVESHRSLRDDFQVSCAELDLLVELAMGSTSAVYGARMTGGGFGGCVVCLVEKSNVPRVQHEIVEQYQRRTGRRPQAWTTRPAEGACVLPLAGPNCG